MYLLPKPRRNALFTLYAVCRTLDDAVDNAGSQDTAARNLAVLEQELHNALHGQPSTPLGHAFYHLHQRYPLNPEHVDALIHSMRMDSDGVMLFPSEDQFTTYQLEAQLLNLVDVLYRDR